MKNVIWACLIGTLFMASCQVSKPVAEKRIIKYLKLYPDLGEKEMEAVEDTLTVPETTGELQPVLPIDTAGFDKALDDYLKIRRELDSLKNVGKRETWIATNQGGKTDENKRLYDEKLKQLSNVKGFLYKGAYRDTTIVKEDSLFRVVFNWRNGVPHFTYTKKQQAIPYIKSVTKVGLNPCKEPTWFDNFIKQVGIVSLICWILLILYGAYRLYCKIFPG